MSTPHNNDRQNNDRQPDDRQHDDEQPNDRRHDDSPTERFGAAGASGADDRSGATAVGPAPKRPQEQVTRPQPSYLAPPTGQVPQQSADKDARAFNPSRQEVLALQLEEYGGVKLGSAFFGWVIAVAMVVLFSALAAAILALLGFGGIDPAIDAGGGTAGTVQDGATAVGFDGIVGAIIAAVVLFLAFYCGGYVAGRMARFTGAKQGLAVWVWSVVIAVILGVVAAIFGNQIREMATTGEMTSIPGLDPNNIDLTGGGLVTAIISIVVVLLVTLGGALLGGLSGMRFHRLVDRVGLGR
ncbi:MAG: hypothetical protein JWQ43_2785 [Glaciihabitans sp.]|nr:hypothetical protein [Glaciihabitans sp.]